MHAKMTRGFESSGDGVRDVVELEIEPDPGAGGQNRAHNFRTFGRVKLEADFEKGDFAAELFNEFERLFLCGDVQRNDDFVSRCCHRNIGLWPVCPDCKSMFHSVLIMSSGVETSLNISD